MELTKKRTFPLKIYFAGAIRGGRDDAELYGQLINYLSSFGKVLTEHVGNSKLLQEEKYLSEKQIFDRDMEWLQDADLVIAEVSTPSLGVGYEIAIAEKLGKDILCLHRLGVGKSLSAMIAGNPALRVRSYQNQEEAQMVVEQAIALFVEGAGFRSS